MKNRILIIIYLAIFNLIVLLAQAQNKELQIGQRLPVKSVSNTFNYPSKTFSFSKAKGKILILDFWSTWCGGCIKGLGRLNELQKKFSDKVLIIPVNYQTHQVVEKFWRTNPITQRLNIMTITDDKVLSALFPHNGLPFEVWFDPNGRYLGSTELEWVNQNEINKIFNGGPPDWIPITIKKKHDFSNSLKSSDEDSIQFYSMISKFIPQEKEDLMVTENRRDNLVTITCLNHNILSLYDVSLGDEPDLKNPKRRIINIKDTTRLRFDKSFGYRTLWDKNNRFCYELKWPVKNDYQTNGFAKMRSDLDLFFNYKSEIKTYKTKCYRLIKNDSIGVSLRTDRVSNYNSLATIVGYLNILENFPIIISDYQDDEKEKIYFELSPNDTIESVNKKLASSGYALIPVEKYLNYFVLRDR